MVDIRIKDLPANNAPSPSQFVGTDLATTQKLTIQALVDTGAPVASQAEAEAGVNATKRMTPLTTKQAIAAQSATIDQVAEIVAIASALSPASTHTFTVVLGQTSVGISGGYQIGKVSEVFLSGVRISGWTASDGDNVTFPAISLEDLGGEANAELVVMVGFPTTGFAALDQRFILKSVLRGTKFITDFPGWDANSADMSSYLQSAIDSGYSLLWPEGTYPCKNLRTTVPQSWIALGKVNIVNCQQAGDEVEPLVWLKATASIQGDFDFDHSAYRGFINNPAHGGPSIIDGALVVSGDDSVVQGCTFRNGHDNGLAIVGLNPDYSPLVGSPNRVKVSNCLGWYNGLGTLGGAAIDVGTGKYCVISNCVDFQSYTGFILDVGAGSQCEFVNCVSLVARAEPGGPEGLIGGYGFYIGGNDSSFTNCRSFFAEADGVWLDATGVSIVGGGAVNSGWRGLRTKRGSGSKVTNFIIAGPSQEGPGIHPGIMVDSSGAMIDGLSLTNCDVVGTNHKDGVLFYDGGTGNRILATITDGNLNGVPGNGGVSVAGFGPKEVEVYLPRFGIVRINLPTLGGAINQQGVFYRDTNGFVKAI